MLPADLAGGLAVLERGGAGVELEELDEGGGTGEFHVLRNLHDGTAGDIELLLHFHYREPVDPFLDSTACNPLYLAREIFGGNVQLLRIEGYAAVRPAVARQEAEKLISELFMTQELGLAHHGAVLTVGITDLQHHGIEYGFHYLPSEDIVPVSIDCLHQPVIFHHQRHLPVRDCKHGGNHCHCQYVRISRGRKVYHSLRGR